MPYLGGVLALSVMGWPLVLTIVLVGTVGFLGVKAVTRLALLSRPESVMSITFKSNGDCLVETRGGSKPTLHLLARHRVFPHLVMLQLKTPGTGSVTSLVLDRRACGSDGFRQLKLRLLAAGQQADIAGVY